MKIRIEVLTQKPISEILKDNGYIYDNDMRYLRDEDNVRYKIAWVHLNDWGRITYIDLVTI